MSASWREWLSWSRAEPSRSHGSPVRHGRSKVSTRARLISWRRSMPLFVSNAEPLGQLQRLAAPARRWLGWRAPPDRPAEPADGEVEPAAVERLLVDVAVGADD